jgi:prevent-host-death family protein
MDSIMPNLAVTSTEFQTRAGLYIEKSGKAPVFITKHKRPVRVLLDIDQYERLMARDSREAISPEDLTDQELALLRTDHGPRNAHLDHLMD